MKIKSNFQRAIIKENENNLNAVNKEIELLKQEKNLSKLQIKRLEYLIKLKEELKK